MPPRYVTFAILAFWAGTAGWLFYRDLLPRFAPGQPPPFAIDLADEAHALPTRWTIFKNGQIAVGKEHGYLRTWVGYRESDDTFEMASEFKYWLQAGQKGAPDFVVENKYRITREGELRELHVDATCSLGAIKGHAQLDGEVIEHLFHSRLKYELPFFSKPSEYTPKPVAMKGRGSILNTLQPVNRLPNLRQGQRWRIPTFDLLEELLKDLLGGVQGQVAEVTYMDAEVLPDIHYLEWSHRKIQVPCLVIEYHGGDAKAFTWVRESDGLVLMQQGALQGDEIILMRD